MNEFKLGQVVNYNGYEGTIVAFIDKGIYSTEGEFAVISPATSPLAGPHPIIHCSLIKDSTLHEELGGYIKINL